jgi:hypothetical protein
LQPAGDRKRNSAATRAKDLAEKKLPNRVLVAAGPSPTVPIWPNIYGSNRAEAVQTLPGVA